MAWSDNWCVTNITVKNHSCCGHTFAAIDAALELRSEGLEVDRISSITIDVASAAVAVAGNPAPTTPAQAKFSIEYCVAAGLVVGSVRMAAFKPSRISDPAIRRLLQATEVRADEAYSAIFPRQRAARLTVQLDDGRVIQRERHTRKGDPDDPLTDDEIHAKFEELVAPIVGADSTARIERELWCLHELVRLDAFPIAKALR